MVPASNAPEPTEWFGLRVIANFRNEPLSVIGDSDWNELNNLLDANDTGVGGKTSMNGLERALIPRSLSQFLRNWVTFSSILALIDGSSKREPGSAKLTDGKAERTCTVSIPRRRNPLDDNALLSPVRHSRLPSRTLAAGASVNSRPVAGLGQSPGA